MKKNAEIYPTGAFERDFNRGKEKELRVVHNNNNKKISNELPPPPPLLIMHEIEQFSSAITCIINAFCLRYTICLLFGIKSYYL